LFALIVGVFSLSYGGIVKRRGYCNSEVCVGEVCLCFRWIVRFIVLRSIPGL
jgi:hypothetical protein